MNTADLIAQFSIVVESLLENTDNETAYWIRSRLEEGLQEFIEDIDTKADKIRETLEPYGDNLEWMRYVTDSARAKELLTELQKYAKVPERVITKSGEYYV